MTRKNIPLLLAALCMLSCIPFVAGVATHATWLDTYDQTIIQVVIAWRPTWLNQLLLVITNLGDPLTVVFLAAALAFAIGWTHRYRQAAFAVYTIAGLSAINHLLKMWLQRPRPFVADPSIVPLTTAAGYSFPSGHSSGAMLLYGTLILLCGLWPWQARTKAWVRACGACLIILIGISRIYVQVHYPSDVTVGWLSGFAGLCLLWWLAAPSLHREENRVRTPN